MKRALLLPALLVCCSEATPTPLPEDTITVVTFNTGTTDGLGHGNVPDDGYGDEEAALSDEHYGDGLAWLDAIEDTRTFFANTNADLVGFQEIFHAPHCESVPEEARAGFVCERWREGDPTVAQEVLGDGWQVACHQDKPDKCLAVHERLGRWRGCDDNLCLNGLDGERIPDCGGGSRVGRGVVELTEGGTLTVVSVHGSSGIEEADRQCRAAQFRQVFVDLDGAPAANGVQNIVLGDFNTDPHRAADFDESAALVLEYAGADGPFSFISEAGLDATPTYTLFNIDHVLSDTLDGSCVAPGITDGHPPVTEMVYFDHKPIVCTVSSPTP